MEGAYNNRFQSLPFIALSGPMAQAMTEAEAESYED